MTILQGDGLPEPEFHPRELVLTTLLDGPFGMDELLSELARRKREEPVSFHGLRNPDDFPYWINNWINKWSEDGLIVQVAGRLRLTDLGRWQAGSAVGDHLLRHNLLVGLKCDTCSTASRLVWMTPNMATWGTNSEGRGHADTVCPVCQDRKVRGIRVDIADAREFVRSYNQAVDELTGQVRLTATKLAQT